MLADVVMKLPAWYAARDEVRGHAALANGTPAAGYFAAAAHEVPSHRATAGRRTV